MASVEPAEGHKVWGVVYELNAMDLASLDGLEGYRANNPAQENRYNRMAIAVEIDGAPTEVETYIAMPTRNPPAPSAAYLAQIRDGARYHGLPDEYRAFLAGLT